MHVCHDNAYVIVTCDAKTPLRDFLQGLMRARKLFAGQRIVVAIPKSCPSRC